MYILLLKCIKYVVIQSKVNSKEINYALLHHFKKLLTLFIFTQEFTIYQKCLSEVSF